MRHILLVLTFLFCSFLLLAQRNSFIEWSTEDGLAQSQVRCLYQDDLGYLWVGTLGGVSKFNGKNFTNFSKQDGLLSNQVNAIFQKLNGDIVFGSIGGITIYDGQGFSRFSFPLELRNTQVNDLYEDKNGVIWVATTKGVLKLKNGIYETETPIPSGSKAMKFIDGNNADVLLLCKKSIFSFDEDKAEEWHPEISIESNLSDGCKTKYGYFFSTLGEGLVHIDLDGRQTNLTREDGLISNNITGIECDKDNNLWLRSRAGLSFYDGQSFKNFNTDDGLEEEDVRSLIIDTNENVWIGTEGSGMLKFCGWAVQSYGLEEGMAGEIIMSAKKDSTDRLWLASYDNAISVWDGVDFTLLGPELGLRSTRCWSLELDQNKDIWVGTARGLAKWKNGKFINYTEEDGLPHKSVICLKSRGEDLWIGTSKGLCKIVPNNGFNVVKVDEIPNIKVRSLDWDDSGLMWVATSQGIFKLGEEVKRFSESDGLPDNSAYCAVYHEGLLWVGTESGLCIIQDDKIQRIPIQGGFGSNHINFINIEEDGSLWLGTNNGVYQSSSATGYFQGESSLRHINRSMGMLSLETNQNAFLSDGDILWIGTSDDLVKLDRSQLSLNESNHLPDVVFSEVIVNFEKPDREDFMNSDSLGYAKFPDDLVVNHTQKHFSFRFECPDPNLSESVDFQYRLVGIEDEWQSANGIGVATYSSLSFDDYCFQVRANDAFGNVGAISSFSFVIKPPFWLSWWFIVLEVLALGGIVYLIYGWRRKASKEKLEKERLEYRSKMLALEQQTLNSSMNRHFIFNALNSIQYYINRKDRLSANRYLSSFAKLIRKNLDSSQSNLTSLREEIERVELYLNLEHMRFRDKFEYEINISDEIDSESIRVPSMLLQPFLENSIWHGILPKETPGLITVDIVKKNDSVSFVVTDNGIGIDTSLINKGMEGDHISQGMNITSNRIELIKQMTKENVQLIGPLEIKSDDNVTEGTLVEIILPINFAEVYTN